MRIGQDLCKVGNRKNQVWPKCGCLGSLVHAETRRWAQKTKLPYCTGEFKEEFAKIPKNQHFSNIKLDRNEISAQYQSTKKKHT